MNTFLTGALLSLAAVPIISASSHANLERRSTWFQPSLNFSFVYDLESTNLAVPSITTKTGVQVNSEVYIVDMEQTSVEQIATYKSAGKTVICYFSAGSWESFRSDSSSFLPLCYCGSDTSTNSDGTCKSKANQLDGWNEWWLDIHNPGCLDSVKGIIGKRMVIAQGKGCQGIDPDNVDAFTNRQNFGITAEDEVSYLSWLSQQAHSLGMSIDLKNAGDLLIDPTFGNATQWQSKLVAGFDFNVVESCHQYSECNKYDSFLTAGKPQIQVEYSNSLKTCPGLSIGQGLSVYSGTLLNSTEITLDCQGGTTVAAAGVANVTSSTASSAPTSSSSASCSRRKRSMIWR